MMKRRRRKKCGRMLPIPQKQRRNDPGRPEICPIFALHKVTNEARTQWIEENCRSGALGCVDCKGELAEKLNGFMRPMREKEGFA